MWTIQLYFFRSSLFVCPAALFGFSLSYLRYIQFIFSFRVNYHLFVFRANMGQILCYFAPFGSFYPIFKQYNRLYINICLRYAPGFVHPLPFGFGSFICYRVIYPPGVLFYVLRFFSLGGFVYMPRGYFLRGGSSVRF